MPHLTVRTYMPEGTFSADYYGDTADPSYVRAFLNALKQAVFQLQKASITLLPHPFYFSRCANCECQILTNREEGKDIECHECKHKDRTRRLQDAELEATVARVNQILQQATANPFFWNLVV